MKKSIKIITCVLSVFVFTLFSVLEVTGKTIPNECNYSRIASITEKAKLPISYSVVNNVNERPTNLNTKNYVYNVDYNLFGIIPIKSSKIIVGEKKYVSVLGTPFGVKLYSDGVLVVSTTSFEGADGAKYCPAKNAGIAAGDYIVSINDVFVYSNADLESIVKKSKGEKLKVKLYRDAKQITTYLMPQLSNDGIYKIGIWIKDSSAGIGTLTFYDSSSNTLAGLGHGLCDSDTGKLVSVNSGSIVKANIQYITKNSGSRIGELAGNFCDYEYSRTLLNSNSGIYALTDGEQFENYNSIEVANVFEVQKGSAKILVSLDDNTPKYYDCKIETIYTHSQNNKNFIVKVTDENLINKTGGIVQGMSGSPLLQNGKLIGAVTHVLVDDPTKGYAIFAENMLETAQSVASEQLKEAS